MKTTRQVSSHSKSYGALHVIKNLDLTVSKGEVYGLLGANGAGKSTAIECMLGTKKADTGSISILGMSPQKDRRSLFQQVGVQFQEANYPDKIRVSELCEETACLYNGLDSRKKQRILSANCPAARNRGCLSFWH